MRRFVLGFAGVLAAGALISCKTITEELPVAPVHDSGISLLLGPGPVPTVAPVPIPTPGAVTPVPVTTPPNNTTPAPTPRPVAPPSSGNPAGDSSGDIPNNDAPVARVIAKVAFVECNGVVPNSAYATSAPVGCRVHLDCVAKDAGGDPTRARHSPNWSYTNQSIIRVKDSGSGGYTPTVTGVAAGQVSMSVTIDGVTSNTLSVRFE